MQDFFNELLLSRPGYINHNPVDAYEVNLPINIPFIGWFLDHCEEMWHGDEYPDHRYVVGDSPISVNRGATFSL